MKKRIVWLVVSLLVVLSFLLASCAPAPTATPTITTPTTAPATTAPTATTPTVTPAADKPKYGGTVVLSVLNDTLGFDQVYLAAEWTIVGSQHLVNDRLLTGDWTMGAAGSNKTDWAVSGWMPEGFFREAGNLAESWEIPDDQTVIFHIRQGVRFQNKAPVNGREMDANDVAFSIQYMYLNPKLPAAYNVVSAPGGKKLLSATATDKWTVTVKVEDLAWAFFEDLGDKGIHIVPREAIEKYGDLKDWHNAIGTGPFMLTDYVPGSSLVFVRNPNYWKTNPIGPGKGDQLPYIDGLRLLVMPDKSTQIAAFRTGKVDYLGGWGQYGLKLSFEDAQGIIKTNPETQSRSVFASPNAINVRLTSTDPLAKPLLSQKVRWALNMAIDREAMIRDLYDGHATPYVFFFSPKSSYYNLPSEMPKILEESLNMKPEDAGMVKKMFEYHPDEAKKILAEEGYPKGFKTIVITPPENVDFISVVKDFWSKIDVDLTIDVRERGVYKSVIDKHQTQALFYYDLGGPLGTTAGKWIFYGPGDPKLPFTVSNRYELSTPILDDFIAKTNAVYGKDLDKQNQLLQQAQAYITWLAVSISAPAPDSYRIWQPWIKNFYGFDGVGLKAAGNSFYYAWVDQDLKKAMGR